MDAIKACRGHDLRVLLDDRDQKDLLGHMAALGLKRDYWVQSFGPTPWYVWEFSKGDSPSLYLLFEADDPGHPGSTLIRMTLLDGSGFVISETFLTTGWRCYLHDAKIERVIDGEFPVVTLETEDGHGPGPGIGRQYYAWVGQRFELVRLEDCNGNAVRNRYYVQHFRSGPAVLQREEELIADLQSSNRLRVLRTLLWLGGIHGDEAHGEVYSRPEDINQIRLFRKVQANGKVVVARLQELMNSDDRWLREAAWLAANPKD